MYYRNPQAPKGLLEKEFMRAVDTLLMKARKNIFVYQHIAEYLIDGFKKFGFNNIVDYVIENYVIKDDLCLDEKLGTSLQNRIDQAQKLKIGNVVPNIILPDTSGNEIDLSKLKSEKILILFYASWCPHCQEIVPEIFKLYDKQKEKKIDVLAVSLDEKRVEWIKFIKDNNLNWLNVSDLKGWSGKAASDYYIYATPTMFLVDKARKIIAKPLTIIEMKELF
jgi:peroxiredoxin